MGEVSTIGLDIAKSVFQVRGVDAADAVVIRKASRSKPCTLKCVLTIGTDPRRSPPRPPCGPRHPQD